MRDVCLSAAVFNNGHAVNSSSSSLILLRSIQYFHTSPFHVQQ